MGMTLRHTAFLFATSIAPIVLLVVVVSLWEAEIGKHIAFYRTAFFAMILAVLIMEFRVRLGYRTLRGKLFYLHLTAAIPFLISLSLLAFYTHPLWLVTVSDILFGILAIAGLQLFYKSTQTTHRQY